MKKRILWGGFLVLTSIFLCVVSCVDVDAEPTQFSEWKIRSGVNISHWLSQNFKRESGPARYAGMTEQDFKNIAAAGFDHVRLPFDEGELWFEDGSKNPYTFGLLHQALGWCEKYNLRVLADLHIIRSHHFDSETANTLFTDETAQKRLLEMWNDLSSELKRYPLGFLAYELMNEPVAPKDEEWNRLVDRMVRQIRKVEPERFIYIGSNRWQTVEKLKALTVPPNDSHIVLSFHFYTPFLLTHYNASWKPELAIPCTVQYPGRIISEADQAALPLEKLKKINWTLGVYDRELLEKRIEPAVVHARKLGLNLYCGEFGCLKDGVPDDVRRNWYRDMVSIFKKYDIAYTAWDYKGGFKVFNSDGTVADSVVLDILTRP